MSRCQEKHYTLEFRVTKSHNTSWVALRFFKLCVSIGIYPLPLQSSLNASRVPSLDVNSLCLYHLLHHRGCHQGLVFLHLHVQVCAPVSSSLDPVEKNRNTKYSKLASPKEMQQAKLWWFLAHKRESTILQLIENSGSLLSLLLSISLLWWTKADSFLWLSCWDIVITGTTETSTSHCIKNIGFLKYTRFPIVHHKIIFNPLNPIHTDILISKQHLSHVWKTHVTAYLGEKKKVAQSKPYKQV